MFVDVDGFLAANTQRLVELRRTLHRHPELSKQEHSSTQLVVDTLRASGLTPRVLPSGTGVICDVGDSRGPIVALRAELDALPVQDQKTVTYRSQVPGVCHACGHDAHAAILIGAGLALAQHAADLPGRVRLIFQPAEEMLSGGSEEVIAAGGLEGVSAIYALHVDPRNDVGRVGLRAGPITAAYDEIEIILQGSGGHSSRPHLTPDLIFIMGKIITSLPASLSRLVDPTAVLTVTFGSFHGGTAPNVIPHEVEARGTVRTLNRAAWEEAPTLVKRLVDGVVAPYNINWDYNYKRGAPPVVNDPIPMELMSRAAREALGSDAVTLAPESLGGEDFAWYLDTVPGNMARLGAKVSGTDFDLHSSEFDIDERAIPLGVRVLVGTALESMEHYGGDIENPSRE